MRLITIPVSHYCEKARWALDYAGAAYREEGHAQILHYRATAPYQTRTVPVLVDGKTVLRESADIVARADELAPPHRKLLPADPELRAQALKWQSEFDVRLGPQVRRLAYQRLFPQGRALADLLSGTVPAWERMALKGAFPLAERLMRRGMNINEAKARDSHERVKGLFDAVAAALGDSEYLVGGAFSAADLAFAALSSPLLHAPEHPLSAAPLLKGEFAELVAEFRGHPAGQYALRLYARHRKG